MRAASRVRCVWLGWLGAGLGLASLTSCAPVRTTGVQPTGGSSKAWVHTAAFVHVEDDAIGWLSAADPRLARRTESTAPDETLQRIGTDAILAEDATARIRGGSLDLFAFRARARALDTAAHLVRAFRDPLPDEGPLGSTIARPKLERELLERFIAEERARTADEAQLGRAAADLVRGIVATWIPPSAPQDWPDRDDWASLHLREIRDSLHPPGPRPGADLDGALYPLERLLSPLQFPHGAAAIAELRVAMDDDMRAPPPDGASDRVVQGAKIHLGVDVEAATLPQRLAAIERRLRDLVSAAEQQTSDPKPAEARARELLLVQGACPAVVDSRMRSMAPPPERELVCGALRALSEEPARLPVLLALHDDVLLSFATVMATPPLRTGLLSQPDGDDVDTLARKARDRPVAALAVAFAAELLYASPGDVQDRLRAWRALGEAPLDIVAREIAPPR